MLSKLKRMEEALELAERASSARLDAIALVEQMHDALIIEKAEKLRLQQQVRDLLELVDLLKGTEH